MSPSGFICSSTMLRSRRSSGNRSGNGVSHQSTSPDCSAAEAVAASGMMCHSIRSKLARLPPETQSARFLARSVVRVPAPDRQRARIPFVSLEAEWPTADHLVRLDLRVRIRAGDPLRHDEADVAGRLAEREQRQREGLLQPDLEAMVIQRSILVDQGSQLLADGIARSPSV